MSEIIHAPIEPKREWVAAVGCAWCRDNGGITVRQYRIATDSFHYRHYKTAEEFTQATRFSLEHGA